VTAFHHTFTSESANFDWPDLATNIDSKVELLNSDWQPVSMDPLDESSIKAIN
jgi:hypothetical protein